MSTVSNNSADPRRPNKVHRLGVITLGILEHRTATPIFVYAPADEQKSSSENESLTVIMDE